MSTDRSERLGDRVGFVVRVVALFLIGVIVVAAPVLSVEAPQTASGWALLALGSVAGGVLAGMAAGSGRSRAGRPPVVRDVLERLRRPLLAVAVAVSVGVTAVFVAPPVIARIWPPDCPQPVELRVLTSPHSFDSFQQVAERYTQSTADGNRGCPTVNMHLYAPPAGWTRDTLRNGWPAIRLAEWPRPDVWLADSDKEVADIAGFDGIGPDFTVVGPQQIAVTPIVVGVLASAEPTWRSDDLTWREVFEEDPDLAFVRSDPTAAASGWYATAAIYASHGGEVTAGDLAPDRVAPIERRIARSMDGGVYRVDDDAGDAALLRRHRARGSSAADTAVIVSEQALIQHNHQLGGLCEARLDGVPADERFLRAYYPADTYYLSHQFVRFDWSDSAGPQDAAAAQFGDWLTGADGRRALNDMALRPPGTDVGYPVDASCGARSDASVGSSPNPALLDEALRQHQSAQLPGRLLVLLDVSGSMRRMVDDERSRLDVASAGVLATLDLMTSEDEFGLWSFPGGDDGVAAPLVAIEAAPADPDAGADQVVRRRQATGRALADISAGGSTPLFSAILAGIEEVESRERDSESEGVSAVVAVTDGEDTESDLSPEQLVRAVSGRGVRVFAIAVGEARCGTQGLAEVTESTGGSCREASFATLDATLSALVGVLWGGGTDG